MNEANKVEIPLSTTKLAKLLFYCICFIAVGLWMIISDPQTSNPVFNNPVLKVIASYGSLVMGSFGVFFFTRKLVDKKPGLVISEEGICDNASAFKFGLIPWSDIAGVYDRSVQVSLASRQNFVTIGLHNPDKYISRETNVLKRKLLAANSKNYGSPIHISTNGLKTNHKDLLKLIVESFEKYKDVKR